MRISRSLSFNARCEEFLTRQHVAAQAMAEDMAAVSTRRPAALTDLFRYYGDRMLGQELHIAVWKDGAAQFSNLPGGGAPLPEVSTLAAGQRSWQVRMVEGRHVIFATTALTGTLAGWCVSCSSDIEPFYLDWQRNAVLFAGLAGIASLLFAVGLYFVLWRMYQPLRALTDTARTLAAGDYSARAPASGRDEMGELGRTVNDMAARVDAQMAQLGAEAKAKQTLVDNLSHEMRTPLTAIGGYADYMLRANLTPEQLADSAETIRFESERLLKLSNQLVRLSVLNHERPELSPLSLREVLSRAVSTAAPKAAKHGVQVLLCGEKKDIRVLGQPDLLESLFVNLADNGAKACPAGGTVTLCADALPNGGVRVTVADTGRGMDADALAQLGQPFYRADKARSRAEGGVGLGVALCFAIVQAHGAALTYQSAPGQGTTAAVEFLALPT